jgi:hypothetical protein
MKNNSRWTESKKRIGIALYLHAPPIVISILLGWLWSFRGGLPGVYVGWSISVLLAALGVVAWRNWHCSTCKVQMRIQAPPLESLIGFVVHYYVGDKRQECQNCGKSEPLKALRNYEGLWWSSGILAVLCGARYVYLVRH